MTDYREHNKMLTVRISEFQRLVAPKNTGLANSLEEAIIPLLKAEFRLDTVSRDYIARITGRSDRTVEYIVKLIDGVNPEELLKAVTKTHSTRQIKYTPKKKENEPGEDGLYAKARQDYEESK